MKAYRLPDCRKSLALLILRQLLPFVKVPLPAKSSFLVAPAFSFLLYKCDASLQSSLIYSLPCCFHLTAMFCFLFTISYCYDSYFPIYYCLAIYCFVAFAKSSNCFAARPLSSASLAILMPSSIVMSSLAV